MKNYNDMILEMEGIAHQMYEECDDIRMICNDFIEKINDLILDLLMAQKIAKKVYGDEDNFIENHFADYEGYLIIFEDLLNTLKKEGIV